MIDSFLSTLDDSRTAFVRQPLYEQVHNYFIRQLVAGQWRPGDMLPPERELSSMLRVSTGTVRKAISALVDDGVLIRRQGLGTFVKSFRSSGYVNQFHRFFFDETDDIVPFTMRLVRYDVVPADGIPARILESKPGDELIHAFRVYSWKGEDIGISELWLDAKLFHKMTSENLAKHHGSLYSYYESDLGVSVVSTKDRIKAKCFTSDLARYGRFAVGEPYLELRRIGFSFGNIPVEYRLSYCTSEKFHMAM